jgi:hypothetical protein
MKNEILMARISAVIKSFPGEETFDKCTDKISDLIKDHLSRFGDKYQFCEIYVDGGEFQIESDYWYSFRIQAERWESTDIIDLGFIDVIETKSHEEHGNKLVYIDTVPKWLENIKGEE